MGEKKRGKEEFSSSSSSSLFSLLSYRQRKKKVEIKDDFDAFYLSFRSYLLGHVLISPDMERERERDRGLEELPKIDKIQKIDEIGNEEKRLHNTNLAISSSSSSSFQISKSNPNPPPTNFRTAIKILAVHTLTHAPFLSFPLYMDTITLLIDCGLSHDAIEVRKESQLQLSLLFSSLTLLQIDQSIAQPYIRKGKLLLKRKSRSRARGVNGSMGRSKFRTSLMIENERREKEEKEEQQQGQEEEQGQEKKDLSYAEKESSTSFSSLPLDDQKLLIVIHIFSSLLSTFPYDVPLFIPPILSLLSKLLVHVPTWMQNIIKQSISDFKKSHEDEWKTKYIHSFTEQEVEDLLDTTSSPHYFA